MRELYPGVDGGGAKTVAAIADGSGHVISAGRARGSNYQIIGRTAASAELRGAVEVAMRGANTELSEPRFVATSAVGLITGGSRAHADQGVR